MKTSIPFNNSLEHLKYAWNVLCFKENVPFRLRVRYFILSPLIPIVFLLSWMVGEMASKQLTMGNK